MVLHVSVIKLDNDASTYGGIQQCDRPMNEPGKGKLEEHELRFDSGIVSESNLSENLSETDLKPSILAEFGSKSHSSVTELPKIVKEKLSLNRADSEKDMGVDVADSGFIESKSLDSDFGNRLEKELPKPETLPGGIGPKPLITDEDGDTLFHIAVLERNERLLCQMLKNSPDSKFLDIQNYCFQTSLHLSVLTNQPRITRLLVLAGAQQKCEDKDGNTALHLACSRNNVQCVRSLLEPVTLYEEKNIKFKYQPVVSRPSEYINECNYDGDTCLHIATKIGNIKILHYLFMHGADVNIGEWKRGNTVLHEAAQWGDYRLVSYFLCHRELDVNKRNYARLTAYQLASYYPSVQKLLSRHGAEVNPYDESSDDSDSDYYEDSDTLDEN